MKSVLIIGMGRFGRHMAQKLYDLGHDVLAIDKSEAKINKVLSYVTNAQSYHHNPVQAGSSRDSPPSRIRYGQPQPATQDGPETRHYHS